MTRRIGDFELHELLGDGGMGSVYRATRVSGEGPSPVALKVLHAQYARSSSFRRRFELEAELGMRLDHRGVVRVYDIIDDGTALALVMELVAGRPMSRMIGQETGPIPWARAWPLFSLLLDAVEYAHGQGVVHRDLKPDNVMVTPTGELKVLDFGIAKRMDSKMTRTGTGFGTVDYMAPEQYQDASKVDQRADVYALGMTLYHMLAGRLPWGTDESEFNVQVRKAKGDLPSPTEYYPHIPSFVEAAIRRSIAMDPNARFESVGAMRQALLGHVQEATPTPGPAGGGGRTLLKVAAGVGAALMACAGVAMLWGGGVPDVAVDAVLADLNNETWAEQSDVARMYGQACDEGWEPACDYMAWQTLDGGDLAKAAAALKPACTEDDDPLACYVVGWSLLYIGEDDLYVPGSWAWRVYSVGDKVTWQRIKGWRGQEAQAHYTLACDEGLEIACADLGVQLGFGLGVERDLTAAVETWQESCDRGGARSCSHLSDAYVEGMGVERDLARALALSEQGCALGDPNACTNLGNHHNSGQGVPQDRDRAAAQYRQACADGAARACSYLGRRLIEGDGAQRDVDAGRELLEQACDGGQGLACRYLFSLDDDPAHAVRSCSLGYEFGCMQQGDWADDDETALRGFSRACDAELADGCFVAAEEAYDLLGPKEALALARRGCDLDDGDGCGLAGEIAEELPSEDASAWYRRGCDLDDAGSCYALGKALHTDGKATSQALEAMDKACDLKHLSACKDLKRYYLLGRAGVSQNPSRTQDYRIKACDAGDGENCYYAADTLVQATNHKSPSAVPYMRRGCDLNHAESCTLLGYSYSKGGNGLATDKSQALVLYDKGCRLGSSYGCKNAKIVRGY